MKRYIPLYEAKNEDKYYDVTIENPDTKREIQLMTALSYPEDSEVYKKAVEIKKYLDSNGGKGIDVEDLNDKDKEKLKGLSKDGEDKEEVESSRELEDILKSVLDAPLLDSEKKKVITQQINKAEELRKNYIVYRMKLEKAIDSLNNQIKSEKGKDTTKKESYKYYHSKYRNLIEAAKKKPEKKKEPEKSRLEVLRDQKEDLEDVLERVNDKIDAIEAKISEFSKNLSTTLKPKETKK